MRLLRQPWLHFLLIGFALFQLERVLFPPPLPSVGPLPESRVENLRRQWFSTTGRLPDEAQLQRMIEAELDREVLFREGLELEVYRYDPVVKQRLVRNMRFLGLGDSDSDEALYREALRMELHLGDEVIKRRLVQVMEQVLLSRRPPPLPTDSQVVEAYRARLDELRLPPRYSIAQVFLKRERAAEATDLLARIRDQELGPEQALEFSSPFLPGYRFDQHSPAQLARQFGAAFVLNLERAEPVVGSWVGPIQSTYGVHLVWVRAIESSRDPELEEVREQLYRDISLEQRRATLAAAVADLRSRYEVIL